MASVAVLHRSTRLWTLDRIIDFSFGSFTCIKLDRRTRAMRISAVRAAKAMVVMRELVVAQFSDVSQARERLVLPIQSQLTVARRRLRRGLDNIAKTPRRNLNARVTAWLFKVPPTTWTHT